MMKAKTLYVLLILFFTLYAEETSLSFLFQEALFIEETEGDLEKAIEQYNSILTIAKKDTTGDEELQETISKTEYQLGICYLKLGQKEKAIS